MKPIDLDKAIEQLDFSMIENPEEEKQKFQRGHVGLIIELFDNYNGKSILVTTIHAFYDPKFEYVKYAEIAYVCDLVSTYK